MRRSVRVRRERIPEVRDSLWRNGYLTQQLLAEDVGLSQSTVNSFLNGKSVDFRNFQELCRMLGFDWLEIADLSPPEEPKERSAFLPPTPLQSQPSTDFPPSPPLPVSLLEFPEGQERLNSAFYVERPPIEADCYRTIHQAGALIRIKAPRQMGKTSLLSRILHQAKQQDSRVVALSLQSIGQRSFANPDTFLRCFCEVVSRELNVQNKIDDYWGFSDSNTNCKAYFEEYLLTEITEPITLGLDEVDRIFEHEDIYTDFFGLLRALHEDARRREIWGKLRLVIAHSTEVYVPLNLNQSPFNVGLPVNLPEFTPQQVQALAKRHQLDWDETNVQQLMTLVGGHPFLVRLALYHLARQDIALPQLLQTAATDSGIYSDHLWRQQLILSEYPELAAAMRAVVMADAPVRLETKAKFKLQSIGLIKLQGDTAVPHCNLYLRYFRQSQSEVST